jgi:uncharacterized repeat protein (TIGR01451 family)
MKNILKICMFMFILTTIGCQSTNNDCIYSGGKNQKQSSTMIKEPMMEEPMMEEPMMEEPMMMGDMMTGIRYYPTGSAASSVLKVEKITPREISLSQPASYKIRVTNLTKDPVLVKISENLDTNFKLESSEPMHTLSADQKEAMWDLGKLKGREVREITLTGKASQAGAFTNCAIPDYQRYLCQTIQVVNPRIAITKEMPPEARVNQQIPVKLVVSNTGSGTARNVVVTDPLPARLNAVGSEGRVMRYEVGDLAEGQSKALQFMVSSAHTGTYQNTAKAVADGNLSAEASDETIIRQSQLALTKEATEKQYAGRNVDYEITVKNIGDAMAQNVMITDPVPGTLSFLSGSDGARLVGNTITWNIGDLRPGASRTVKARLKSSVSGTVPNTAYAKSDQAPQVSATDSTLLIGVPGILLEVVDSTDPLEVGDMGTYTITASNQGSAPGHEVRIVCEIEDNMEIVSASGSTAGTVAGNTVTFSPVASLPAKQKAEWNVRIRAKTPGDVRFTTRMTSRELQRPVMETESTTIY